MGPAGEGARGRGGMAHGLLTDTSVFQEQQQARMRKQPGTADTACRPGASDHGRTQRAETTVQPAAAASASSQQLLNDGRQGRPSSRSQHSMSWGNTAAQRSGSRAGGLCSPTHSVPMRDLFSTGPTKAQVHRTSESGPSSIDTTEEAAALFKTAGHMHMLSSGGPESLSASGQFRPPPAGMRGALSWGVGPNAYENDGRPGTRGGREYDLDGRPLTRNGGRPASRMQLGLTGGRPSTGLTGTQPPPGATLEPLSYAAATSSNNSQQRRSADFPGQPLLASAAPARAPSRQQGDRKASVSEKERQPAGLAAMPGFGRPTAANASPAPAGQRPQHAGNSRGKAPHSSNRLKLDEEGDVDAFLDALSDDEVDNANMDDMKNYLNKLSCDGRPSPLTHGKVGQPHKGQRHKVAMTKEQLQQQQQQQEQQRLQQQQQQERLQKQQARHQRAVQAAERVVAVLIEQAVKTAEVNAIIRSAEEKAMAQESQLKVVLQEHGWQDSVRAAVGPRKDEFQSLMSSVTQAGSKMPDSRNKPKPVPVSVSINPDDDFKHLQSPGSLRPGAGRAGNHLPGLLSPLETAPSPSRGRGPLPQHIGAAHGNMPVLTRSGLS